MYSSRADIENKILPTAVIVQLTDDEKKGPTNSEIPARINVAIEQADIEIEGKLLGLYPLPFNPVPPLIKLVSARLAAYNLWSRRSGEKPDNVVKDYTWCQKTLVEIRNRDVQLYTAAPVSGGAVVTNKTAGDREFSKARLDKMP